MFSPEAAIVTASVLSVAVLTLVFVNILAMAVVRLIR